MRYGKPWLPLSDQIDKLERRGVGIDDRARAERLLCEVGYYRLTGYLHPFRAVDPAIGYLPGTHISHAAALIDFDRRLRLLVLDALERIEVSLRMRVGYVLGEVSAFAHRDASTFMPDFTRRPEHVADRTITTLLPPEISMSKHDLWLLKVAERQSRSSENFVQHFREKYANQMPIWALTEILELGQLVTLYRGLNTRLSQAIADAYEVPTKKLFLSWLATLNYVRNVAAHHARLYNRKLVTAPKRPTPSRVPLLAHLSESALPKEFGLYSALAVVQYLLLVVDPLSSWGADLGGLLREFPSAGPVSVRSLGVPDGWERLPLWTATREVAAQ
ncbi:MULTISPECIES: Abi family protein [Microbacterium]|uniref:Abi family protein n=1 Tax=Microbacterium TaxID=33882 RepID=UPI0023DA9337|nr:MULTISPECIES: Abi family protein [Microbacterium]MDF2048081.1 Abi family protein [Microbacterium sp. Kw_RZR3]MDQ1075185.1 abortive infection bacteriophage resistance protein [Microbacterium sp. SORGH_AS_0969]MDQ1115416.1 abortive infection bacteriophage resistance protein [Microbacterium testaceum]